MVSRWVTTHVCPGPCREQQWRQHACSSVPQVPALPALGPGIGYSLVTISLPPSSASLQLKPGQAEGGLTK
eukprot:scaffold355_cov63-Phaeocystis_antarctica.AAC.2